VLQAALKVSFDVLNVLRKEGSLAGTASRLVSFDERQKAVAKWQWDELYRRFSED